MRFVVHSFPVESLMHGRSLPVTAWGTPHPAVSSDEESVRGCSARSAVEGGCRG